jgi:hypothetical protein
MADIFDQAATAQAAPPTGDIFDQAAKPQKDFQSRIADRIQGNFENTGHMILAIPDAIDQVMSQAKAGTNLPASAADVPAYVGRAFEKGGTAVASMVGKLLKDYSDDPANLVGDIVTAKAFKGVGEEPGVGSSAGAGTKALDTVKSLPQRAANIPGPVTDAAGLLSPKLARMMQSVQAGNWEGLLPDRMVHAINLAKAASKSAPEATPAETPNVYGTPRAQWGQTVPREAPAPTPEGTPPSASMNTLPHTLNGDSALRQILTGQDNANLLKIAKSRGINVTKEAALKPGTADNLLVNKIIDDFSPDELEEIRAQHLENTRFRHSFGDIGPEAWKTLSLQTYFPDLKIAQTTLDRTAKAIAKPRLAPEITLPPGQTQSDLMPLLQESLKRARAARQPAN